MGGTNFGVLTTIGISAYGYEPFLLLCTDIDNDNDIDIVTYSNEYSRLHLHRNNGDGTFVTSLILQSISAVCFAVEDFDNDGDKDIFTAGNYYPGIYLIKNNNGIFAAPTLIALKKADFIDFIDLDGDGLKDLVGTATESSSLGTLYYFHNNGSGLDDQVVFDNSTDYSLSRNMAITDINNDSKADIVTSYYYSGKVSYHLNSSTLAATNFDFKKPSSFFPVPFSEALRWTKSDENWNEVNIYDMRGRLMLHKEVAGSYVETSSLPKGIYIAVLKSESTSYSRKIVKN